FGTLKNAKIAIIALLGATMGQAVVWYGGHFYALFFLQNVLKVDLFSANVMVIGLRPILSERPPKMTKNGVPRRSA
ncbi:hypothetical protein ACCS72_39100, partial [Rhizobium ruizarguesonis]